jgi:hypothetical protein
MTNENVTITLDNPGVGSGAALWVSDSGTWWSVVSKQEVCSGCGSCATYNPYNPCGAANPYNPCGATNPYNPCGATNPYNPCGASNPYNPCASTNPYNPCAYYVPCSPTNNPATGYAPASYYTCSMYNPSGYCKYGYTYSYTTSFTYYVYNPCGQGGYCVGASGNCVGSGGNCIGTPGNCIGTGGSCIGTGGNCIATGGSCASYSDTYTRYLKLYKYASNTLTELASVTLDSLTSFAPIRAIKVAVSNSNKGAGTATVTAQAFSDTSAVTQIGGNLVHSATGVNIVTNYGIIASDSAYSQSLSTDGITIV